MKTIALPMSLQALRKIDFPHKLGICEKLFGKSIAREGTCWVSTSTSLAWKLDLANPTHRWIVYGEYEGGAFMKWAREFLPVNGIVVDSGANIGQMLLYLGRYVPEGKVFAFEPSTEAADWLEECLVVNRDLPVDLRRLGLGEWEESLFMRPLGPTHVHGAWNQISRTEGQSVRLVRLDAFLASNGIDAVDLWKLDVEGYELQALRGAERLLQSRSIRAIYAELGFGNGAKIVDYLAMFGYDCYLFGRGGRLYRPSDLPQHTNGLFLPASTPRSPMGKSIQ